MNIPFASRISAKLQVRKILISTLVSIAGTFIVLFPSNPRNMSLPSRDSGVFLYVGWRFLSGDIPYRDVWDHKPPLIYFVDAIGLALTPNSVWGVWILQLIFVFFTLLIIYNLLDREFGTLTSIAGTIVLTSGLLTILEKGNVTEEYALAFQALGLWLFVKTWSRDFPIRDSFWIGVAGGIAFNFKQTTIGIWITYAIVLLVVRLFRRKFPFKDALFMLAGWLAPSIVLIAFLASQHALADYWQQAFLYNFIYIGTHEGISRLIPVFVKGFLYLRNGWVLYLSVFGWMAGIAYVWFKRKVPVMEVRSLILIALIELPVEVLLVTTSGHSILHYYLTPLPIMAILSASLVHTVPLLVGKLPFRFFQIIQRRTPEIVLLIIILGQIGQIIRYPEYVSALTKNNRTAVIHYLVENTTNDQKVLIIGAESAINFLARRESPTRYVYQYPLALTGSRPMFEEYFNQILENKPTLIIDTRGRTHLDENLYVPLQKRSKIVRDGVQFLGANYQQVAQFGDWFVYRLIEK